jgi:predicted SAM-dependent methyltransferase
LKNNAEIIPLNILDKLIKEKKFNKEKLRLNIGGGDIRYTNCINLELEPHPDIDADIYGDITNGFKLPSEVFYEVLFIHVIEHIERKFHVFVFDEIWRILKPNGRLVMSFPDAIEIMKRFINNKYGGRWNLYHNTIFGRQARKGDYHVTAIEKNDITDKLINSGFVNINYNRVAINATLTAYKGEKLNVL